VFFIWVEFQRREQPDRQQPDEVPTNLPDRAGFIEIDLSQVGSDGDVELLIRSDRNHRLSF